MGKLLVLVLLVCIFKCNGQLLDVGGFAKAGQRQVQGALGLASSILGGVSSGLGLNFGGQFGFNSQKRPQQNYNGVYPNEPQTQEGFVENQQYGNNYVPPKKNHGYRPHRPSQGHHQHQRPESPQHGPGYEQQQHHGYPNQYNNQNYYNNQQPGQPPNQNNPFKPGRPSQHQDGNYNNNGNYGNIYPNTQNPINNPGYQNQGFNNNGNSPVNEGNYNNQGYGNNNPLNPNTQTTKPIPDSNNTPGYGSNIPYDESNQEYLNNINNVFGNNPQYPNNGLNSDNSQTSYGGGLISGTEPSYNGGLNSGTQKPNNGGFTLGNQNQFNNNPYDTPTSSSPFSQPNKATDEPKEDLPTFIPLNTMEIKRETETKPVTEEDEEFAIDIRVKEQQ